MKLLTFGDNVLSNLYFCVDIETTSLKPKYNGILECYYKVIKNGLKIDEGHMLFYHPLWWRTKKIHQIPRIEFKGTHMFNSKNKEVEEFKNKLIHYINRCKDSDDEMTFMAQYAPFEMSWFSNKLKIDLTKMKVYDTRLSEKMLYPKVSHSLIPMCDRYGIEKPKGQHDFHRADQDVNAMYMCYKKQIKNLNENHKEEFTEYDKKTYEFKNIHR